MVSWNSLAPQQAFVGFILLIAKYTEMPKILTLAAIKAKLLYQIQKTTAKKWSCRPRFLCAWNKLKRTWLSASPRNLSTLFGYDLHDVPLQLVDSGPFSVLPWFTRSQRIKWWHCHVKITKMINPNCNASLTVMCCWWICGRPKVS